MTDVTPNDSWTPDDWANYVNAAHLQVVLAVLGYGAWVDRHGGRIQRTPADNRHRYAFRNLHTLPKDVIGSLPYALDALYPLAQMRRLYPAAFDAAVEEGQIRRDLTRRRANRLLRAARESAQPRRSEGVETDPPAVG